jgi:hypothetical protein
VEVTGPRVYQALVVRKGLEALKIGLKLNSAYTLSNCLATAEKFTGGKYPRRKSSITFAVIDLTEWIVRAKAQLRSEQNTQPWADPMPETPMPEHP